MTQVARGDREGNFWAPDVTQRNGQYYMYYAVSRFGQRTSAIGLATSPTLDPMDPAYHWTDRGIVLQTNNRDSFNAIDPSVMLDGDGRLWMTFGHSGAASSLWSLIPPPGCARRAESCIQWPRRNRLRLLILPGMTGVTFCSVNWGLCCRGVQSTYNIRVGRSTQVTGPYKDKDGKDLMAGGGTMLLGTDGRYIGPGQIGILRDGANEWMSYHYYDGNNFGQANLGLRKLEWDAAGWPVAGKNVAD